jgi:hypothetical protein
MSISQSVRAVRLDERMADGAEVSTRDRLTVALNVEVVVTGALLVSETEGGNGNGTEEGALTADAVGRGENEGDDDVLKDAAITSEVAALMPHLWPPHPMMLLHHLLTPPRHRRHALLLLPPSHGTSRGRERATCPEP